MTRPEITKTKNALEKSELYRLKQNWKLEKFGMCLIDNKLCSLDKNLG